MTNILKSAGIHYRPELEWLRQAMLGDEALSKSDTLPSDINWTLLVDLSETHGMMPLLYQYLSKHHRADIPDDVFLDLEHRYKANELRNRILAQELLEVMRCLESHDIPALAYKGPSLTLSVYGDLALRQFGDLDILIKAKDVPKACVLLSDQGYTRTLLPWPLSKEHAYIHMHHEHEFISTDQLVHVDLHWALSTRRFPFELQPDALFERAENLSIANGTIKHISSHDMILLLCMHINKDLWRKFVWVYDIDRLIRSSEKIDWDALLQASSRSHCYRMLHLSLLTCHELLGTPVPESILLSARKQNLDKKSHKAMQLCFREEAPDKNYLQCLAIETFILSICDSTIDRFKYIIRGLVRPTETDMVRFNLPIYLHFIYYLVTPIRRIFYCTIRFFKRLLTT